MKLHTLAACLILVSPITLAKQGFKHAEELSRYLVMVLMTQGIATMPYGSSELLHSSLQEKGQPSGRMAILGI
ncbi:hypothetical protein NA76_20505 [Vibrio vulnificus]|nr:hypothetical protein NA76_20505 [Vibrio vulnificus]